MTNVLVICDDVWHPGEVIMRGLKGVGEGKITFDFVMDAKDILTPEIRMEKRRARNMQNLSETAS